MMDEEASLVYLPVEDPTSDYFGVSSRQQPLRRQHRVRRPEDRPAQVALDRASPDLGLRHVVGADPARRVNSKVIRRSPCRASSRISMCSIASAASRSGRSKNRCSSPTCRRKTSPTQPFPASRRPMDAHGWVPDDLIDFRRRCGAGARNLKNYRVAGMQPRRCSAERLAACAARSTSATRAGTNWPGAGADQKRACLRRRRWRSSAASRSAKHRPPSRRT